MVESQNAYVTVAADGTNSSSSKRCSRKWSYLLLITIICLLLISIVVLLCIFFFRQSDVSVADRQALREYANYSAGDCSTYQCGKIAVRSKQPRIIGGDTVSPYSWPWQGALMKKNGIGYYLTCGATLISDQWLITAAHCVQNDQNPANYLIKLGVYNKNANDEPGEIVLKIASIIVHPNYSLQILYNDIALLKLYYSIRCNDHIVPICLPNQGDPLPSVGRMITVTGWGTIRGTDGNEVTSSTLRQVEVPLIDESLCKITYDGTINYKYSFCAGYKKGGKDACQGDSGGPAVYRFDDKSNWIQLGITSWGDGCGKAYKPGVYTRVSSYISWIKQYTYNY